MKTVVAIGGNMISDASKKGEPFADQFNRIQETAKILSNIAKQGYQLVITHGNGPQVGSLLLQQQSSNTDSTQLPLKILGALTQGQIGVMLQHALINEFKKDGKDKSAIVIPTTVIVDQEDKGFQDPSKPIGPFYSKEEYDNIEKEDGMVFKELNKGYRRVVPSPTPVKILEAPVINDLVDEHLVIAVGGGGSPTINNGKLELVDAVIDKDLASSHLALDIDADMLIILTNIEGVYRNFNTDNQELIPSLSADEANILVESGELGKGSMEPKVKAAINFAKRGKTIISSPDKIIDALEGKAGTVINP